MSNVKSKKDANFMSDDQSKLSEFKTLMNYAKTMHSRYFHALSAFYAHEALCEVTAPNIVGESEASKNVKVIDNFKNFFLPTKEALRVYFLLELAKMFDSSKQALHIDRILNFTESNLKNLTVEAFKEYNKNQDRPFLEELAKEYRNMAYTDLTAIKTMLSTHKTTLEKLDIYRDKWLAHDDINKPEAPSITVGEIKALFGVLAKMLNSITARLNSESWIYSHVEDGVKHHTRSVIDHLRRFEPYRLQEIEEKYRLSREAGQFFVSTNEKGHQHGKKTPAQRPSPAGVRSGRSAGRKKYDTH